MSRDFSSESLQSFLREAAVTGRMHPATARSRRKAAEALVAHLSSAEATDLRNLDFAALRDRIANSPSSDLRPEVADLYIERLAAALVAYAEALPEVSSSSKPDAMSPPEALSVEPGGKRSQSRDDIEAQRALEAVHLGMDSIREDVFPIPLGDDRVVFLHGVPHDLTAAEARKIARVVEALVQEIPDP
ncbi:MAG: hypothetical protein AAF756_03455 [Pseudomonadota bacterium]